MLILILLGFFIGCLMPAIASRFGKILPADPGLILLKLGHRPHFPHSPNQAHRQLLRFMWIKFGIISVIWGFISATLFALNHILLSADLTVYADIFMVIVCLCILVDAMYFLLPDFFTLPLLLFGFLMLATTPGSSVLAGVGGAFFGYGIATLSVVLLGLFHPSELGAGDVKMMTALGAWLGVLGLSYTLLLSFLFFAIPAAAYARRSGAYGPALGWAAILTFFFTYVK